MNKAVIENIVDKLEKNRERDEPSVLFLGAGASVTAGIPTTRGLIDYIKSAENINEIYNIDDLGYFEVMERLDPGDRRRILDHFIRNSNVNKTHLITALLVLLNYVDCIITTNFDPLIKNALTLLNIDFKEYDIPNNVNILGQEIAYPSIIYLHGEYRNVWKLNTAEELQKNKEKTNTLISKAASHNSTWIVVGYSGNDLIFQQLCEIEVFNEGLYWVGFKQEQPPSHVKQELLSDKTKNVKLVNGFTSDSFFESLFNNLVSPKGKESIQHIGDWLNVASLSIGYSDSLNLETIESIKLTSECQEWAITKSKSLISSNIRNERTNIFESIKNRLQALFTYKTEAVLQVHINNKEYDSAIVKAEEYIRDNSERPLGYYYKGAALGLKAEAVDISTPKQAVSLYEEMDKAFATAQQIAVNMNNPPSILDRIEPIKTSLWRTEHNLGINYARPQDDLHNTVENPREIALGHLKNATIVQSDKAITWNALAQVYSQVDNNKEAAVAQEKYLSFAESTTLRNYLLLAQYYNLSNQPEKAPPILQKSIQKNPDKVKPIEMIADIYEKLGEEDESINLVKSLVQKDPSNSQYLMSLGVKIYQKQIKLQNKYDDYMDKIESLQSKKSNGFDEENRQVQQQINKIFKYSSSIKDKMDELNQYSLEYINEAIANGKKDASAYNALGVIYLNKAHVIFKKRNVTLDDKKAEELNKNALKQLQKSKDYYKKATQLEPDTKRYWESLYQVYTALGNEQKAAIAKQKAGLQE